MSKDSLWYQVIELPKHQQDLLWAFVCRILTHEQVIQVEQRIERMFEQPAKEDDAKS